MVDGIHKAMDEGLIGHIGATSHAPEDVMLDMIDSGIFEAITVSYHQMDRSCESVIQRAHSRDVGVVIMNPLGGGMWGNPVSQITDLLGETGLSSTELALKFVLDHPDISCAISGFSRISPNWRISS